MTEQRYFVQDLRRISLITGMISAVFVVLFFFLR